MPHLKEVPQMNELTPAQIPELNKEIIEIGNKVKTTIVSKGIKNEQ